MYFSKVYLSKVYFCKMYPTCVSSKLCEFILQYVNLNKIILDECSTVVEIDHVRNLKDCLERKNGVTFGNIQYTYDDTGCNRLLAITGRGP